LKKPISKKSWWENSSGSDKSAHLPSKHEALGSNPNTTKKKKKKKENVLLPFKDLCFVWRQGANMRIAVQSQA
jgi:hypothetical protein